MAVRLQKIHHRGVLARPIGPGPRRTVRAAGTSQQIRLNLRRSDGWRQKGRAGAVLQEMRGGIQRFADRHIHIQIAIGAQTPDKCDPRTALRQVHIVRQQRFFLQQADRIIGNVVRAGRPGGFAAEDGSLMLFPGEKCLCSVIRVCGTSSSP